MALFFATILLVEILVGLIAVAMSQLPGHRVRLYLGPLRPLEVPVVEPTRSGWRRALGARGARQP